MSQQGPLDWLTIQLGYNAVQASGVAADSVATDGIQVLNFVGCTVTPNAAKGTVDVTPPSAATTPDAVVNVVHSGAPAGTPLLLVVGNYYEADVTSGEVVFQLPSGAAKGLKIPIKLLPGVVPSASHYFQCNAVAAALVEMPLGSNASGGGAVATPGTWSASGGNFRFNVSAFQGAGVTLQSDGANNWSLRA